MQDKPPPTTNVVFYPHSECKRRAARCGRNAEEELAVKTSLELRNCVVRVQRLWSGDNERMSGRINAGDNERAASGISEKCKAANFCIERSDQ